jgi:hypothetical protein
MDVAGSRAESWYNGPLSKSQANPGLQHIHQPARTHLQHPRPRRDQKSQRKCSPSAAARSRAQAASGCRRARATAIHGGAESAVAALVGASGVKMTSSWSAVLNGGERGGLSMRRSVHEVHGAARASRGRSGSPKVRVCTRLACGFWPAGRQLAWLRGGLQWRVEVDFPTAVSMLWGHVASCRLTRPRRSLIAWSSVDLLSIFTSFVPNSLVIWRSWICSAEEGCLKKRGRIGSA